MNRKANHKGHEGTATKDTKETALSSFVPFVNPFVSFVVSFFHTSPTILSEVRR